MYRDLDEKYFENKKALHLAELWSIAGDTFQKSTITEDFSALVNCPLKKMVGVVEFILWKYVFRMGH